MKGKLKYVWVLALALVSVPALTPSSRAADCRVIVYSDGSRVLVCGTGGSTYP